MKDNHKIIGWQIFNSTFQKLCFSQNEKKIQTVTWINKQGNSFARHVKNKTHKILWKFLCVSTYFWTESYWWWKIFFLHQQKVAFYTSNFASTYIIIIWYNEIWHQSDFEAPEHETGRSKFAFSFDFSYICLSEFLMYVAWKFSCKLRHVHRESCIYVRIRAHDLSRNARKSQPGRTKDARWFVYLIHIYIYT